MRIFPAIDLYEGKAVRLYKGDYQNMTVYSSNPVEIALDFYNQGAKYMHLVDLEGARDGGTPNINVVKQLCTATNAFTEVGGGIRSMDVVERYVTAGVNRLTISAGIASNSITS